MFETHDRDKSTLLCTPSGDLDWISAFSFRHFIGELYHPGDSIVVDLSRVPSIDATGLSALVGAVRRVLSMGGAVQIRHVCPAVLRRLQLVGLDRFLVQSSDIKGSNVA